MQIEKEIVFRLDDVSLVRSWKIWDAQMLWDVDTTFQYQGFHV